MGDAGPARGARAVTIRDVAAAAGVSTTTVSHALNGKGRVGPATRERVIATAQRLGYRASRAGRALRTARSGTIAFLIGTFEPTPTQTETLSLDIYMQQASSAARAAFAHDTSVLLSPPIATEQELRALGVDGGIVCDPLRGDPWVGLFEAVGLPVVTIERDLGRPDHRWFVRAENEKSTRMLLDHMAEAGGERIAMLRFDADIAWAHECEGAYRDWCESHGREPLVVPTSAHRLENSAYRTASRLLDGPAPPDAIFAAAERFAAGALRAAHERGLRIPEDLIVATGIDSHDAREASPPVTAIDVQPPLQGAAAAELLVARINDEQVEAPRITPHRFHLRASTGPRAG
jgi:DNA-binding LacI/PurR family transcriptional regulator